MRGPAPRLPPLHRSTRAPHAEDTEMARGTGLGGRVRPGAGRGAGGDAGAGRLRSGRRASGSEAARHSPRTATTTGRRWQQRPRRRRRPQRRRKRRRGRRQRRRRWCAAATTAAGDDNSGRRRGDDGRGGDDDGGDDGGGDAAAATAAAGTTTAARGGATATTAGRRPARAGGGRRGGGLRVVKVEQGAGVTEITYSNGVKEEIENGRYEHKTPPAGPWSQRPATQADLERIRANVRNSRLAAPRRGRSARRCARSRWPAGRSRSVRDRLEGGARGGALRAEGPQQQYRGRASRHRGRPAADAGARRRLTDDAGPRHGRGLGKRGLPGGNARGWADLPGFLRSYTGSGRSIRRDAQRSHSETAGQLFD